VSRRLTNPLAALAAGLLVYSALEFGGLGLFAWLGHAFDDQWIRLHIASGAPHPDPRIVVVDIDERSLEQMATTVGRYPWPRSVHAELAEGLLRRGARAVVFDLLFTDPDLDHRDGDAYLAEVAQRQSRVFFPMVHLSGAPTGVGLALAPVAKQLGLTATADADPAARAAMLLPLPGIVAGGRLGLINFNEDADGIGRRYDLYQVVDGWRIPSLPARVARALDYPLPDQADILLNWRGPAFSYRRVSYADLYRDLQRRHSRRPADEFRNAVVLVGSTATGQHDLRATPVGALFPAVEIVATALDNLEHGDWLRPAPRQTAPLLTLLLIVGLYLAARRRYSPLRVAGVLALLTVALSGGAFLALDAGWQVPVLRPLLFAWVFQAAAVYLAHREERRAREHSVQLFSRFLDPRVVHQLVDESGAELGMRGESRTISVLFSDIRNFTTMSEQSTPEAVLELLNDYFSRQVRVIFDNRGTIDKFIGDAIMAFWGAPVDDERQAVHAVHAALDMVDALLAFRDGQAGPGAELDIGIGIHTGPAVVGFIGSENRIDYTAIGDTVNLASRIEGQTKGRARVLVSQETRDRCGEAFDFIDHGSYKVKGRTQEVRLFEPRRRPA